jgi:hypothetical protein
LYLLVEKGRPVSQCRAEQQGQAHDRVAWESQDYSLRFGFRAAVDREGSHGIALTIGGVLTIENHIRGNVQEGNLLAVGQFGQDSAATQIDPLRALWIAMTVRHSSQRRRMHNPIRVSIAEGFRESVWVGYVQRTQGAPEQLTSLLAAPSNDCLASPDALPQDVTAQLTARSS